MNCEWNGQVHALHDGELASLERTRVESHIAGCAECAAEVERLRRVARFLKAASTPTLNSLALARLRERFGAERTARLAGWLTAAAAVVLFSCGAALVTMQTQSSGLSSVAKRGSTTYDDSLSVLNNAVVPGSELATAVESADPLTLAVSRDDVARDDGRE